MISNSYLLKALRGMSGKVLMCIIMVLGYMTAAGNLMWNTQKRIRGRIPEHMWRRTAFIILITLPFHIMAQIIHNANSFMGI